MKNKKSDLAEIKEAKLYLWPMRALTIGTVNGDFCTNNIMNSLVISANSPIVIEGTNSQISRSKYLESKAVLIEPASKLKLSVKNSRLFILSLTPLTADIEFLLANYSLEDNEAFSLFREFPHSLISAFLKIDSTGLDASKASDLISKALNPNNLDISSKVRESRIRHLALSMLNNPNEISTSEEHAKQIGLSKYRMLHLFKSELGMTWGNFKKICKLKAFNYAFAQHQKLTDSAHEANFTDLAHFSKTFKGITGSSPNQFYGNSEQLKIYIDQSI
ncbi:AraC family transcriptional regulator [Aliikangiella sp. G2MR2-5]|uniref:helix-turn-helix domain-containing protein n=1 Tax=Aliikangiella sp. G2MR2-5 TaxID=2788943 RepID=UPI0018A9FB4D|nr:helix-turn-helix domain-containing protein [Aliikangiella sp. G2MR2-5]